MVEYAIKGHQVTLKRACRLFKLSRTVYRYQTKHKSEDPLIKEKLLALSEKHKRYGFWKLYAVLKREGFKWNNKRVYRVYCELKLNLRKRPKKRLPAREKLSLIQPSAINICWSLDFMSDALMNGRRFRTVNILDDANREALGIKASFSLPSEYVTAFLDEIALQRGYPLEVRVDNGPENISKVMQEWAENHGIKLAYIQPGKPAQNAYIERFNRTYREEILDMNIFYSIAHVQQMTDEWVLQYNGERPHESLGNLTPWEYGKQINILTHSVY